MIEQWTFANWSCHRIDSVPEITQPAQGGAAIKHTMKSATILKIKST